jgi:hypothetical protein
MFRSRRVAALHNAAEERARALAPSKAPSDLHASLSFQPASADQQQNRQQTPVNVSQI